MDNIEIAASIVTFVIALGFLVWGIFMAQLIPNREKLEHIKKSLILPKTNREAEMAKTLRNLAQFMPWALCLIILFALIIGFMLGKMAK